MANNSTNYYCIADLYIRIVFQDTAIDNVDLLPSFEPFRVLNEPKDLFFQLVVNDTLTEVSEEHCKRIRAFDNGDTIVDRLNNGGYQYIIKDLEGKICCLLQTNKDFSDCTCKLWGNYNMRCFGLQNALMMIFSFGGSFHQTLLIHASLVRQKGYRMLLQVRFNRRCLSMPRLCDIKIRAMLLQLRAEQEKVHTSVSGSVIFQVAI